MSPPVPNGIPPELSGRATPPAGTPGTEGDTAQHVNAEIGTVIPNTHPGNYYRVKHLPKGDELKGWSEAERVAFLRRAQQEGNR